MKNKLFLAAYLLLIALLLVSCKGDSKNEETEAPEIPENGVYYEYSGTGAGGLVESSTTYQNGIAVSKNDYDYWPNGRLKSITTTKNGAVTDTWSYNYAENGLLSQMVRSYSEDGFEYRDDYRYDENGNMITVSVYDSEDTFLGGERYTYSEKSILTKEETLDRNGDAITYTVYTLEGDSTVKSESFMYGSLSSYGIYEYNDKGSLTGISYYSSKDSLTGKVKNEYNSEGKIIRTENLDADGAVISYTECLYDEDGFNYRDIFYEGGQPVYRYDYTKDGARIYSAYN